MAHIQELVISNSCVSNPEGSQKPQNASAPGPLRVTQPQVLADVPDRLGLSYRQLFCR